MRPARPCAPAARLRRRGLGRRGIAASELALLAPLLALIILATADLVLFLRAQVKIDGTAVQLGQTVSQCERITAPGDVEDFWRLAQAVLGGTGNVAADGTGTVIVSGVTNVGNANRVVWQHRSNSRATSAIGPAGGAARLPGTMLVPVGHTLIVTEVYAPVQPWVLGAVLMNSGVLPSTLGATSLFLSRAPDPATVAVAPANSNARTCMA